MNETERLMIKEELKNYLRANTEENPDTVTSTLSYWDDESGWYKKREEQRKCYTIEILKKRREIIENKINQLIEYIEEEA